MPERPRILIPVPTSIDFEYGRQNWPQYAAAVREAGGEAIHAELTLSPGEMRALALTCSGVVLPGNLADVAPERYGHEREESCGPADVAREQCDRVLLEHAFATGTPLLAICYGMQSLNVFLGGTLLQDIDVVGVRHTAGPSVGVAHSAVVAPGSRLAGLLDGGELQVGGDGALRLPINSSHHQAVGVPGDGLRVVARSVEDGVVEAIEPNGQTEQWVLGVQWHPERTVGISATSRAIFRELLDASARFAGAVRAEAVLH